MGGKQRAMGKKMGKRMKSLFGLRGVLGVLFLWPGTAILAGMQDGGSASSANRIEDSNPESVSTNGDYRIGPGDVIVVSVWKEPEASSTVVIRPDGKISLPLVNDLSVDGKTPMEVQKIISEKLAPFIKSPNVTVTVQEIYSKKVFVLGEVNRAGAYQITQPMTVLQVLTEALGFRPAGEGDGRLRFEAGEGGSGAILDLLPRPGERHGRVAVGTVHHVAWRTPDAAEQERWQASIAARGGSVSPVIDRFWFRSIYFREPGGVLFEIATDGPGFTVDERAEELGDRLILPPWLEAERPRIEAALPPLQLSEPVR